MIRVAIQQSSMPVYRVPVFRELARRQDIALTVVYGQSFVGIKNATPEGFTSELVPMTMWRIGNQPAYWHSPQTRLASKSHCDVLILQWDMHFLSLVPALIKARLGGVHTILWGHGYSKTGSSWRSRLRNWAGNLASAILVYNHRVAHELVEAGWSEDKVFVAQNCVDQVPIQEARARWLQSPELLDAFRREHGLVPGPALLFVSRLAREKNVSDLLEAVAILRSREFPELKLILIGDGPSRDEIWERANSLNIGDAVRMPGAIYEEEKLAPWFLCAGLFCYPTDIGLSLQHAMGYGLPVVTHDNAITHGPEIEALEDGINGKFYRQNDTASLVDAIRSLLTNDVKLAAMSRNAVDTALSRYTVPVMVDGMEAAIRFCVDSGTANNAAMSAN